MNTVADDFGIVISDQRWSAPAATAYGWHLRTLLRAVADCCGHLLNAREQRLIRCQEAFSASGMDRLARLLQRVDAAAWDEGFTGSDGPLLELSGWGRQLTEGRWCASRAGRALAHMARDIADGGRGQEWGLPVTIGLDGRDMAGTPLARTLAGARNPWHACPWATRHDLDAWREALGERRQPCTESAWLRAFGRVSALDVQVTHLRHYHLQAAYHWCKRLQECTDALPADPRRVLAALRALRPLVIAPSLARWQGHTLYRFAPLRRWRRQLAGTCASWGIWSAGEAERWYLRARGERRTRAWPEVPTVTIQAWIDHDAQGGVIADGLRVEMCALRHLQRQGWQGIHAEGGFWLGLCMLLARQVILSPQPEQWPLPWQHLPLDWGRWGFVPRREEAVAAVTRALVHDALAVLEESLAAVADCQFPGWAAFPDPAVARAVCANLPGLALARMVRRLLIDPREAAGLPDLLCWRDGAVQLWEVKSPGDALSDGQRSWLSWFQGEGVHAGVIRVEAQVHRQMTLLVENPAVPEKENGRRRSTTTRLRKRGTRANELNGLQLLDEQGRIHRVTPGAAVPGMGELCWARQTTLAAAAWSGVIGNGCVRDWQRPVDRIAFVACHALRWDGIADFPQQRWLRLGRGMALPILIHHQAREEGGLQAVATLLTRRSGWLIAADAAGVEPVVEVEQELRQETTGDGYDWEPHPRRQPFRPLVQANAEGYGDELQQQLDLVAGMPHALETAAEGVAIALPEASACLWISDHPRIQRSILPWLTAAGSPPA